MSQKIDTKIYLVPFQTLHIVRCCFQSEQIQYPLLCLNVLAYFVTFTYSTGGLVVFFFVRLVCAFALNIPTINTSCKRKLNYVLCDGVMGKLQRYFLTASLKQVLLCLLMCLDELYVYFYVF